MLFLLLFQYISAWHAFRTKKFQFFILRNLKTKHSAFCLHIRRHHHRRRYFPTFILAEILAEIPPNPNITSFVQSLFRWTCFFYSSDLPHLSPYSQLPSPHCSSLPIFFQSSPLITFRIFGYLVELGHYYNWHLTCLHWRVRSHNDLSLTSHHFISY